MIEVVNKIGIWELDGTEVAPHNPRVGAVEVRSHHQKPAMVVLVIDGKSYTVLKNELEAAVKNAGNSAKY